MKLSNIPLANIKVGDRCISAIGTMGAITLVDVRKGHRDGRNGWIKIEWENKNISEGWYDDGDGTWWWEHVDYLGRPRD
jgi:hypothetical protein